jgi:hypothetical protein
MMAAIVTERAARDEWDKGAQGEGINQKPETRIQNQGRMAKRQFVIRAFVIAV